ncbi:hypothetical protein FDUTEX481_08468 [Tolypothrix sp. PCC 7601]|nr:hypothetical protein FDUTEX481_08468 [Tolypothrix sp. PCC 7601]
MKNSDIISALSLHTLFLAKALLILNQIMFATHQYILEGKAVPQYCSVKDFQVGIWFGEKVKG